MIHIVFQQDDVQLLKEAIELDETLARRSIRDQR